MNGMDKLGPAPVCPLCQSRRTAPVATKIRHAENSQLGVWLCGNCDVQFLHPMASVDELTDYYNGEYRKEYVHQSYYCQEEMDKFFQENLREASQRLDRIRRQLDPQDEVLEIGCASGYFLSTVAPWVKSAAGTEWDANNEQYAKAKGFDVRRNIDEFAHSFDKIFLFHVLEHILDPVAFLKGLRPFLKENGVVYVEVPNRDDVLLKTYHLKSFCDFYYQTAHLWYFNRISLEYVCRQAGFSIHMEPLQRYDFSNHIHWMTRGVPGGQGMYAELFSDDCNQAYIKSLAKNWQTDTLFCRLQTCPDGDD
jgi:2-polyprenyl-3-methyl-5-hydroxy-6-metoxy-1,4-benzoquinol methylase